eukprot:8883939-Pyramimonas_sp.AAC.1
MYLSLERIGWEAFSPLDWPHDLDVEMLYTTHSMAAQWLRMGTQRHHARVLGIKLGREHVASVVCLWDR